MSVEAHVVVCYGAEVRGIGPQAFLQGVRLKILVVGGGGREHALVWKLSQSRRVKKIYAAPGNAGMALQAECADIPPTHIDDLLQFALRERVGLTVVGPEAPLTMGIVDRFHGKGLPIFGPAQSSSILEGSKVFAKNLMVSLGIPTADFEVFEDFGKASSYIKQRGAPIVIKADGLAAGKGVIVAHNVNEALHAAEEMLIKGSFGDSGRRIVVEDCLKGEEVSVLAFTDGESVLTMIPSQDHKPIYDGDKGPNTGGMGAYAPAPLVDEKTLASIEEEVIKPVIKEMAASGKPYVGVLYAGLLKDAEGLKVLEFNCRFGDPEAQALLPLMKTDLFELMERSVAKDLSNASIEWRDEHAVCVVLASGGYPAKYEKGKLISGLDEVSRMKDIVVLHAGTAVAEAGVVTSGGRVLGVTGLARSLEAAIERAYEGVAGITFDSVYFRRDIGAKGLR
jgi:phosphoribosylamine--glycine ligase